MPDSPQESSPPQDFMRPLGQILIQQEVISPEELDAALAAQARDATIPLGQVLVQRGTATDVDVARALSVQLDIPFMEFNDDYRMEREEVGLIPESIARRFGLLPVKRPNDRSLTLVLSNPLDVEAVDLVRSATGLEIHKAVGSSEQIFQVIEKFYRQDAHIERDLKDIIDLESGVSRADEDEAGDFDADQLLIHANDAPVVKFVNLVLMEAIREGASDIHFEPGDKDVSVRLRVDGQLRDMTPPPKSLYPAVVTRIKILSTMDIAERRLPLDGRFRFTVQGHIVDVRVSSLPEIHGEKMVLRLLDRSAHVVDMEQIGFEGRNLERFKRILGFPHGIILLTGPTGSGKTTTLYSALTYLRSGTTNIQTVEDPVEYQIDGINQMQIRPTIGLDFARALRHILRQDPDVVLIGEMRDLETAGIAMRASLTGHLVLSTLHTNDTTSSFSRLRDIGIEPYLIAATVKLVISQRLVRRICSDCRTEAAPPPEEMEQVLAVCPEAAGWTFYRGAGCKTCRQTGYRGRQAIFEFLEVTSELREQIHACTDDVELRRIAIQGGLEPLSHNGFQRVKDGTTTPEEVIRVSMMEEI